MAVEIMGYLVTSPDNTLERTEKIMPGKKVTARVAEKGSSRSALIVTLIVALIGGLATVLAAVINERSSNIPFAPPQASAPPGPHTSGETPVPGGANVPPVGNGGTTHEYVYHAARNPAGESWFNSGTANTSKGRNSFTIKDLLCDDDWGIQVQYWFYDANESLVQGNLRLPGDCSPVEESRSIPGGSNALSTTLTFHWRAGKYDNNRQSADTWEPWITTTIF